MWAQLQGWVQRLTPWFWFIISLAAKSKATFPFVLLSGVRIPGPDLGCCFSGGALIVSEVLHHSCAVSPCRCRCDEPAGTSLTYFLCCAPCGGGDQTWQSGFLNFSLPGWFKKEILEVPGGWRMGKAQVSQRLAGSFFQGISCQDSNKRGGMSTPPCNKMMASGLVRAPTLSSCSCVGDPGDSVYGITGTIP